MGDDLAAVLIDADQINGRLQELAAEIDEQRKVIANSAKLADGK